MILETERLFLREMAPGDRAALCEVLGDADNMRYYPHPLDGAEVDAWIARNRARYRDDGFGLWAVCLKGTGELIGDCGLTLQRIDGETLPEVGYHIRRDCQRRGYAAEAARAVVDWAFAHTDFPALYSYCRRGNAPSIRTAEAAGMRFVKEYPDAVNGVTHVSGIAREAWQEKNKIRRQDTMKQLIAYCGLDCEACEARKATMNDDDALREKVAKEWSELNGVEITPEMINCAGCRVDGPKTPFCDRLCPIRQCALGKGVATCGGCGALTTCGKVKMITENNAEALNNLKG